MNNKLLKGGGLRKLTTKIPRTLLIALAAAALLFTIGFAQGITIDPNTNVFTLREGEVTSETLTVTVEAQAVTSKADVYLLADTTGSMYYILDSVKSGAGTLVNEIVAALPETDLRFAVGNYKDFPYDPYAFDHQLSLTSDLSAVQAAIGNWTSGGGYDGSEGQFFALDRLADDADPAGGSIGWRGDAEKIVVWFGDAPAHDPVCGAISGLPYDITEASVTTKLTDANISVIAISTITGYPAGLDDDPTSPANDYSGYCSIDGTPGQATRISAATGGTHVTGIDPETIVPTIVELVEAQVKIIENLSLVPAGDIVPFVTEIDPAGGYGPIDTSSTTTWDFDVTFTGIPCGETDQTYNGTIDVVADGSVEAQKTVEITVPRCLIEVGIDIKPGSYPNSFNLNGNGVIPVAVLGSADFDVTQVDVSSLSFAGLAVRVKGNGTPQCSYDDVSGDFTYPEGAPDGYTDLVCQFIDDPATWIPGDGFATLTGYLLDGTPISGTDSIRLVP